MSMIDKFERLAAELDTKAANVRSRVARASTASQLVMRAEAAAYERSAASIRAEIARALEDNGDEDMAQLASDEASERILTEGAF